MKILNTLNGAFLFITGIRIFDPKKVLKDKRVAIVGAADSALQTRNGEFIESYDVIIRVNKALHTWNPRHEVFLGKRTDILFHSFYENESSGGGPISFKTFRDLGMKYLVHPDSSARGLVTHLNFYKRNGKKERTFLLDPFMYRAMNSLFGKWKPTVGFAALYSVLNSPCKEVYITGFTFFKTSYAGGYRDHLKSKEANDRHIEQQGLHNPDLEFSLFKQLLERHKSGTIVCDEVLDSLLKD